MRGVQMVMTGHGRFKRSFSDDPRSIVMIAQSRPLIDVLAESPDFRKARGKRHDLKSILALAGHGLVRVRTAFALEVRLHNLLVLHRFLSQRRNVEAMHHTKEELAA